MFGTVKRIVPPQFKRSLRATFDRWLESHPLSRRMLHLEHKVAAILERHDQLAFQNGNLRNVVMHQQHWLQTLLPDQLLPGDAGRARIAALLERNGIEPSSFNLGVSKSDVMFQYMAGLRRGNDPSVDSAFAEYFASGLNMFQVLSAVVGRKFGTWANVRSCLDFACGCGRLTRFLVTATKPSRICVSDIRERAVQFLTGKFGVNGFVSTTNPDQLQVSERFDVIFAGSLFTHLPPATFAGWVRRLWEMLTPNGLLVFTANDVSLRRDQPATPYVFSAENEERLAYSADGWLDPTQYGNMFVTEGFVREFFDSLPPGRPGRGCRYPRGMWRVQDVYVAARDDADLSGIDLPLLQTC